MFCFDNAKVLVPMTRSLYWPKVLTNHLHFLDYHENLKWYGYSFCILKKPDISLALVSKDIDKMFNSTCRMPLWILVPLFSKFAICINLWDMTFRNNPLSLAKRFHFYSQSHIELFQCCNEHTSYIRNFTVDQNVKTYPTMQCKILSFLTMRVPVFIKASWVQFYELCLAVLW